VRVLWEWAEGDGVLELRRVRVGEEVGMRLGWELVWPRCVALYL
jgi:hypothetical protein